MADSPENDVAGIEVECHNCGHTWNFKGLTWSTPCPNCDFQTETGLGPADRD
jgi:Zn finger protein HypA/HybF involved in hydrogenase expression